MSDNVYVVGVGMIKFGKNIEQSKLWDGTPIRVSKKVENQDIHKTVSNYEKENNVIIQLIFDKNGTPRFPLNNKLLENGDIVLVKSFKKDKQ